MEEYEYTKTIDGFTVHVNKVGGGTLGEAYEGDWEVVVMNGDVFVLDNNIIHTGTPKTHAGTAREAIMFAEAQIDGSY